MQGKIEDLLRHRGVAMTANQVALAMGFSDGSRRKPVLDALKVLAKQGKVNDLGRGKFSHISIPTPEAQRTMVLEALAPGVSLSPKALVTATGLTTNQVTPALQRLEREGKLRRAAPGLWATLPPAEPKRKRTNPPLTTPANPLAAIISEKFDEVDALEQRARQLQEEAEFAQALADEARGKLETLEKAHAILKEWT